MKLKTLVLPFVAAAALLPFGATAADAPAKNAAGRLQQVADKQEIIELLLEYGRTLDRKDYASYGRLFARDGEWVGGGAPARGPKAIEERMRKTFGPESGVKWTSDFHLFTNPIVKVEGDRATAWSRWLFISPGADGRPVLMYGGHYDDVLVREDGAWRFQRREVVSDMAAAPPKS
ncbi:MAG: nuclear transport factor 2 family protein [Gammaproteobacteria bacterium]|nr:nuclear transport factor 2 family protein [Gammaproteobacteria bacterium]